MHHYIVVQRGLPFGVTCAMVAHAAGESFYAFATLGRSSVLEWAGSLTAAGADGGASPSDPANLVERECPTCPGSSEKERLLSKQEVAGSSPAPGSTLKQFIPDRTVAVILGARNAAKLHRLSQKLAEANVPHVLVFEPDEPYCGQLMAIGLVPGEKALLADHVRGFHMLPDPSQPTVDVANDSEDIHA